MIAHLLRAAKAVPAVAAMVMAVVMEKAGVTAVTLLVSRGGGSYRGKG